MVVRPESAMRQYQRDAVAFAEARPGCALFLKPGLGKTVIGLTLVRDLIATGDIRAALVIGPIRVIEAVWRQEAAEWEHLRTLRFSMVRGGIDARNAALARDADVYLINYEHTPWLFKSHAQLPADLLIVDESSAYKAPGTLRFRALRYGVKRFARRVILTGTPRPNSGLELWPQLFIVDEGDRLGRTFGAFKGRFYHQVDFNGYKWAPWPGAEDKIKTLIADVALYLDRASYLELPPIVYNKVMVTLPEPVMAAYRTMERKMFLRLLDNRIIDAANAAVVTGKLQQIANGAAYVEPAEGDPEDARPVALLHLEKLTALDSIVNEAGGPVLVAYSYIHDLERLKGWRDAPHLGGGQVGDTNTIVDAWNRGELPVLYLHPRSASHGLNLQKGGNTIVFFSQTWSAEQREQLIARLHRSGQEETTVVHDILAEGTIDVLMNRVVAERIQGQENLLMALKHYAEGRVGKRASDAEVLMESLTDDLMRLIA